MKRDLFGAARMLVLPTLALLFIVAFVPGRTGVAVRIYALVLCAVALGLALIALRRAYPPVAPLRERTRRWGRSRRRQTGLAQLENETALGIASAFDLHHRLRPRLRSLALELLRSRRRISLDDEPEAARMILGEETWELVRRDRPPPEDRLARGLPPASLGRVVESLEQL